MSGEIQLTIESVTNPGSASLPEGVLGEALKRQQEHASEVYVGLAEAVVARLRNERGSNAQRLVDLEREIEKLKKREAELVAAMAASTGPKGIFPLCAELGIKQMAIQFCRDNALVVPPSDADVWKA